MLAEPHGIDLGPLQQRIPEVLKTASGAIEVCPEPIAEDVRRLREGLDTRRDALVLIGRRHLRSNNSWMHNVPALAGGSNTCTLQVHPDDAARLGLQDNAAALVRSRSGQLQVTVEHTEAVPSGVVSLPHGWGHGAQGTRMEVAAADPGVNANVLTDPDVIDPLSGTSVLNGVPVDVLPAP
ncbi:molybdopterin dinucleotide binding domain-containing protein [Allosalinactinospora lopnorensis]|uniref:molybdopterin dinucleotide binding domain-containing protein n=1 Tax=Allosalinactinospora lopnorensis TaxID=1352348 RepID=UPI000A8E3E69